ncbi:prepilin peptidase [Salmonella enterica subsp. enterica serovar 4,[5],12:b:-]|nr:prepilin peptidase [Salmonella enterica subsp. enterica serovar 4,[5],12:b:-]
MLSSVFNTTMLCCANIVCQFCAFNEVSLMLRRFNIPRSVGPERYICLIVTTAAVSYLAREQLYLTAVIMIAFYGFLSLMGCMDLNSCLLPRIHTVTFLLTGVAFRIWQGDLLSGLICSFFIFFIMLSVRKIFAYKNGTESLGFGDVLLMTGTGMWFPSPVTASSIVLAASCGGIIFFIICRMNKKEKHIPFGPFLCGAMFIYSLIPGTLF